MPDNQRPELRRLLGVDQESSPGWERALRRTFAARTEAVRPSGADLAGSAIARARRTQRRRWVAGSLGVVVASILATGAVVQALPVGEPGSDGPAYTGLFGDPVDGPPGPDPQDVRLAADQAVVSQVPTGVIGEAVAGGLVLVAADGRGVHLGRIGEPVSAHQVGDGWAVVTGTAGAARLWWVAADGGEQAVLLSGMDAIHVAGNQVAWRRGVMLASAVLSSSGELGGRASSRVPDGGGEPVGFLGGTVLLRHTTEDGSVSWGLWEPAAGGYQPGGNQEVIQVYGELPGQAAIGLVAPEQPGAQPCLARWQVAATLTVDAQACLPGLPTGGPAAVSPDGRWLVAAGATGEAGEATGAVGEAGGAVAVMDLAAALAGEPEALVELRDLPAADGASRPVWVAADRAVLTIAGSIVSVWPQRVLAGEAGAVEVLPLSGDAPVLVEPELR